MTTASSSITQPQWHQITVLAWGLCRLLIAAVLLYLGKDWILNILGDPHSLTLFVIGLTSTPASRLIIFVVFGAVLTIVCYSLLRARPNDGYWIAAGAGTIVTLALFRYFETSLLRALPVVVILVANLLPDKLLAHLIPAGDARNKFMTFAAGIAEALLLRHFLNWLIELSTGRRLGPWPLSLSVALAAFLASGAAAVLLHPAKLAAAEQGLRMSPSARIIAENDFNWIELDDQGRYLFVTGHGVPRIERYDTSDLSLKPQTVSIDTGNAQAFAFDREAHELHVYNERAREMLTFDTRGLELQRRFAVDGLASGDPWLVADHNSNTIVIVSEADENDGISFVTLDRTTGAVRDVRELDAGNLLLIGETSKLYMSFFRRRSELLRYDLDTLTIDKAVPAPPRADRMIHWSHKNEVLLTEPVASRILRYDAETMALKGEFKTIFGVRTIAIDAQRNLLICASLATGEIAVMDLNTFKVRARHYLGPWLRSIVVDPVRAVAYVSSNGFLYELTYDAPS